MKAYAFSAATAAGLLAAASAAAADDRTYDFTGFDAVSVSSGIEAEIAVGGDFDIVASGEERALDRLEISVRGDELHIRRQNSFGWRRNSKIYVNISMPTLKGLDASSGSGVSAEGVSAEKFSIDASSGAGVEIAGACTILNVDASSGAQVDARDFQCQDIEADASSGASVDVFASRSAEADASSGASIDIYGGPEDIDTDESSGGDVDLRGGK